MTLMTSLSLRFQTMVSLVTSLARDLTLCKHMSSVNVGMYNPLYGNLI